MNILKRIKNDGHQLGKNPDLWLSYQDEFQGYPIMVKVNITLLKINFLHTLYVKIPYLYNENKPFPDEQELAASKRVEEQIDRILKLHDHIKFIGSAIYKGNISLLYVSDDYVKWLDLIKVNEAVMVGKYEDDRMNYCDRILCPPHILSIIREL